MIHLSSFHPQLRATYPFPTSDERVCRKWWRLVERCLGPFHRSGPDPDLVFVGWGSEPDPYGPLGPGDGVRRDQLLDAVLPQAPGAHWMRHGRRADGELAHLLWLQAPGLAQGGARSFGHLFKVSN